MKKRLGYFILLLFSIPHAAIAMHISEGFLPPKWTAFYFVLCLPFVIKGVRDIKKLSGENIDIKMLLGLVAAYCFVLSSLKLPSVTGSSSHLTGAGFGAIIFGPSVMAVIATIVLIFQAIFLAHGGITTLGANSLSMAIAGPIELGLAFPAKHGDILLSVGKFIGVFAITQIPLAIVEGIMTVVIFNFIGKYCSKELKALSKEV